MHAFKKEDFDQFEENPFDKIGKDWMLVTAGNEEKANTMTASWGGMGVMWGKNVVFVFIRDSRFTKEFIDREGRFSLSFPSEEYRKEMKYLGTVSGRDEDKIAKTRLTPTDANGIPFFEEAKIVLICKKLYSQPMDPEGFVDKSLDEQWYPEKDYHVLYAAEIEQILVRKDS